MSSLSTIFRPGHGPVIDSIKGAWSKLELPNPPKELVNWIPGVSPLSTNASVVIAIVTYFVVIFGGRELMR